MTYKLYVIIDKVAQESGPIFEAKNDACALRKYSMFMQQQELADQNDYKLVTVGEIDHETNEVQAYLFDIEPHVSMEEDQNA